MASGNMFRKPRSMSRATNPMQPAFRTWQPGQSVDTYAGSKVNAPDYGNSGGGRVPAMEARQAFQFNPIAPAVADARANAQFDQKFAGNPMSSFDASRMAAGRTANNAYQSGVANGYANPLDSGLDPRSLDEREKLARANAAYMMGGGPASDPTNLAGRFGGAPAVSQATRDAQARMARGQASDQLLGSLVSPGQGPGVVSPQMGNMLNPMYKGPFAKRQPDGSNAYTNREGAFHDAFPGLANPSTRDATLQSLMETNPEAARAYQVDQQDRLQKRQMTDARAQKFKDEHGGMSARQFGIQSRQDKRETARYRKAIMQGLNPMSPQAQGLFPDQTKSFMEQRRANQNGGLKNPMAASNPFQSAPGGGITPDDKQKAKDFLKKAVTGATDPNTGANIPPSSFIANTGVTGDEDNIQDFHFGMQTQVQQGVTPTDDDLNTMQKYVQALKAGHGTNQYDPFDMTYGFEGVSGLDAAHTEAFAPMYKELADLKNPTPETLRQWWSRFSARVPEHAPYWDASTPQSPLGYELPKPASVGNGGPNMFDPRSGSRRGR